MASFNEVKKQSRVSVVNRERVKTYTQDELKQLAEACASKLDTYWGNIEALQFALNLPKGENYKMDLFNRAILNLRDVYNTRLSISFLVGFVDRQRTHKYKFVKDALKEVGLYTMVSRTYFKQGYQRQLGHRVETLNGFIDVIYTSREHQEAQDRLRSWKQECIEKSVKPEALQLVFTE